MWCCVHCMWNMGSGYWPKKLKDTGICKEMLPNNANRKVSEGNERARWHRAAANKKSAPGSDVQRRLQLFWRIRRLNDSRKTMSLVFFDIMDGKNKVGTIARLSRKRVDDIEDCCRASLQQLSYSAWDGIKWNKVASDSNGRWSQVVADDDGVYNRWRQRIPRYTGIAVFLRRCIIVGNLLIPRIPMYSNLWCWGEQSVGMN